MGSSKRPGEPWLLCPSKMRKLSGSDFKIRKNFFSVDAYTKHKMLINEYLLTYKGAWNSLEKKDSANYLSDREILKQNHRFVWNDDEMIDGWEKRMCKKYYDKLSKEYCLSDLTKYKENKIALRWRTEAEVVKGKGQFICADLNCEKDKSLKSWQVNFSYSEDDEKKIALVKIRLCPKCSLKLNYHHQRKEVLPPNPTDAFSDQTVKVKEEILSETEDQRIRLPSTINRSSPFYSKPCSSSNSDRSEVKEKTQNKSAMSSLEARMDEYLTELLI